MSGPEPRWPDPTRPEKSRRRSVVNVRGLVVVVLSATALVALTGVLLAGGDEHEPGGAGASPHLQDLVKSIPSRAFRDQASRRKLIRDSEEVRVAADNGVVAIAEIRLARMRRHVDGCDSELGTADADDWVVDCAYQIRLRSEIERSIESLRR